MLGLMRAAGSFDEAAGKWSTHAWWWVYQRVCAFARKRRPVNVPCKHDRNGFVRIHAVSADEEELALPSVRADQEDAALRSLYVARLLERLDDRERLVIRLRFGLDGAPPVGLTEVGVGLGLCRERVRQIEAMALAKMAGR